MINMDAFKQPISGEIEFTVLDVIEKDIPKKKEQDSMKSSSLL